MENEEIYPKNLREFEEKFRTEIQCRDYLFELKYPNGYVCPKCGNVHYWVTKQGAYKCKKCQKKIRVTVGTIFQDSHISLTIWFRAIWYFVVNKNGISALSLQRILGLGSYKTAWTMLHKIRKAMVRPNREKLNGVVEVDELFIGGVATGIRGRGADKKCLVAIAVEVNGKKLGRVRLKKIEKATSDNLMDFIDDNIEKHSEVVTDGFKSYKILSSRDYTHSIKAEGGVVLPKLHMTISLLKRWILGTLQGSCSKEHLESYLNEYEFRYNRRMSKSRGLLFQRVLENGVITLPTLYPQLKRIHI